MHLYNAAFTSDVAVARAAAQRLAGARNPRLRPKGYRFRGRGSGGRALRVLVRRPIDVAGGAVYSLDEPAQGAVAVRLSTGLLDGGWCATDARTAGAARVDGRIGPTGSLRRKKRSATGGVPTPPIAALRHRAAFPFSHRRSTHTGSNTTEGIASMMKTMSRIAGARHGKSATVHAHATYNLAS